VGVKLGLSTEYAVIKRSNRGRWDGWNR